MNNRGPEEWNVFESDGKHSLQYLGYNETVWTHEFTYPILCYGHALWGDYTLEVRLTPFNRKDLNGIIFRYRDGRHYYLFGLDKEDRVTLRYRDGEKGFRQDGWHELAYGRFPTDHAKTYRLRVEASGTRIRCSIDDREIFDISDRRYSGGKVGLFATSPVAFHEVRVSATAKAREEFTARKVAQKQKSRPCGVTTPNLFSGSGSEHQASVYRAHCVWAIWTVTDGSTFSLYRTCPSSTATTTRSHALQPWTRTVACSGRRANLIRSTPGYHMTWRCRSMIWTTMAKRRLCWRKAPGSGCSRAGPAKKNPLPGAFIRNPPG